MNERRAAGYKAAAGGVNDQWDRGRCGTDLFLFFFNKDNVVFFTTLCSCQSHKRCYISIHESYVAFQLLSREPAKVGKMKGGDQRKMGRL